MTAVFYYNNVDLGNQTVRLGSINGLVQRAENGEIGFSEIEIDDPGFSLNIQALRGFYMNDYACSSARVYSGFGHDRTYRRVDSLRLGGARRITLSLIDLNAELGMHLVTPSTFHYLRPVETDAARIAWLLAQVIPDFHDNGLIDGTTTVTMSAADYRGQFATDVLRDMAARSGKNFFAYADPTTFQTSLAYFKSTSTTIFNSTLSISNVLSDLSSTCFMPYQPELTTDPSQVYSGVYMTYNGGTVYVTAPGRAIIRDTVAPAANTSDRTKAIALATTFLENSENEYQTVTCTLKLPASQVNLLMPGMRVSARFSNFQTWETGQFVRVLERRVAQDETTDALYNVTVRIGHPVEVNFRPGPLPGNEYNPPPDSTQWAYIQGAKTPDNTLAPATATFAFQPTPGNLLVAGLLVQDNGHLVAADFIATMPSGWNLVPGFPSGSVTDARLAAAWIYWKIADAGEPNTVSATIIQGSAQNGFLVMAEYRGPTTPSVDVSSSGALTGPSNTGALASQTPSTTGSPALIVEMVNHEPNYFTSYTAGWNNRVETEQGGPRQAVALVDQLIAAASGGAYTGTATAIGGAGESKWFPTAVTFASPGGGTGGGSGIGSSGAIAALKPSNSVSDMQTAMANTSYSTIQLASGTYTWDNVMFDTDRTSTFPLLVQPAPGATCTFVGSGTTGDGIFRFGHNALPTYMTMDATGGSFVFDGITIASAGVFGVNGSNHLTFRGFTFQNLKRDSFYANQPYKSWAFYMWSEGGRVNNNLLIDKMTFLAPFVSRDVSCMQVANAGSHGKIDITNVLSMVNYDYGFYADTPISALTLDTWSMTNVGNNPTPASIRFTAVNITGTYKNITATLSDPLLNNSTGTMTNGGGNSGI